MSTLSCLPLVALLWQIHVSYIPGAQSAASIGEALLEEADRLGARTLIVASHGPGDDDDWTRHYTAHSKAAKSMTCQARGKKRQRREKGKRCASGLKVSLRQAYFQAG
eukprot:1161670-Pelagomonas_calceolata.AAC.2